LNAIRVVEDGSVTWISDIWTEDTAQRAEPTFGVLKVPFDYAVSSRPGARFGPRAVCEALRGYSAYSADKRVSFERAAVVDFGEVEFFHSLTDSYDLIRKRVAGLPRDVHPVFLGGDHSITDPIIRGMLEREQGPFGLIVFDAHFDSRVPIEGHEHSGHWMHTIRDVFSHEHSVQIGINAPIYSQQYMQDAQEQGVLVITPYDLRRLGWQRALNEAAGHASGSGERGVYVSIDIDALDRSAAPGTAVPNPVGLSAADVVDAVFEISRDTRVVGLDVTEVSPPLDSADATAQVAAHLVHNHWAGLAVRPAVGGGPLDRR
jgi:agmatinase